MTAKVPAGRVFYGWYVALGVGLTAFIAWGAGFYQLGVFTHAFHDEHGWGLTELSFGTTLFYVIVGVCSLVTGRVVDRHGPRRVLMAGAVILSSGMLALGEASTLGQVFLAEAVLAVGFASTSTLVLGAVIGRWFRRRRAFVMTLALSGAPLGALVLVPVSTLLIERYSISDASRILALVAMAIVLPLALFVIDDDPAQRGQQPDGDVEPDHAPATTAERPWNARAAAATPVWRLLTLSYALIMLCQVAFLVHQIAFLAPVVGEGRAAVMVSVTGAAGIAGRFTGGLGDRLPKHSLMAAYCLLQALGVLLAAASSATPVLLIAAALVGFTMGNTVALQPVLMAERFGMRSYGTVFGPASLLTQFGAAAGLTLVGFLADTTGSYAVPFALTGSLAVVAAAAAYASGSFALRPVPAASPAT